MPLRRVKHVLSLAKARFEAGLHLNELVNDFDFCVYSLRAEDVYFLGGVGGNVA